MTLYQPFLDYAIALLQERLNLQPYAIPQGFELKQATVGKGKHQQEVLTTSYAYQTIKLRQIRAAHVQGSNSLQVLNFVFPPSELRFALLWRRFSYLARRALNCPRYATPISG